MVDQNDGSGLLRNVKQRNTMLRQTQVIAADGAVLIPEGLVLITKGSICVITIDAPADLLDGAVLEIVSTTDFAHTVTFATTGFNGGGAGEDVATFAVTAGATLTLYAYNNNWYTSAGLATDGGVALA